MAYGILRKVFPANSLCKKAAGKPLCKIESNLNPTGSLLLFRQVKPVQFQSLEDEIYHGAKHEKIYQP